MRVTVRASTGCEIDIWREGSLYLAKRAGADDEAQVCIALDLFEVIAELAELDLEVHEQSREAIALAKSAQRDLGED